MVHYYFQRDATDTFWACFSIFFWHGLKKLYHSFRHSRNFDGELRLHHRWFRKFFKLGGKKVDNYFWAKIIIDFFSGVWDPYSERSKMKFENKLRKLSFTIIGRVFVLYIYTEGNLLSWNLTKTKKYKKTKQI